jgi:predicted enzyme related to lactoylglutathione lyase
MTSADGSPRSIPIIRVPSIDRIRASVERAGGTVVVEPFTISGVGRGCYVIDPAGVLIGLHEYDPEALPSTAR